MWWWVGGPVKPNNQPMEQKNEKTLKHFSGFAYRLRLIVIFFNVFIINEVNILN